MMKKTYSLILFLIFSCLTLVLNAQNIVVTSPQSRNVVLEEFTGIHCGYCPEGHVIAQSIYDDNTGRVVLVNVHAGGYAVPSTGEPDFRTDFGDSLAMLCGVTSYPSGTVNRHLFTDFSSSLALSRSNWLAASSEILSKSSPINVGFQSSYNSVDSILTVDVEVYYRDSVQTNQNFIQVALLENLVYDYQGGSLGGNNYEHNHILRHFLTGQWGDQVDTFSTGTLVSRQYTYKVPADYDIDNCDVAVYVTEDQKEVITGVQAAADSGSVDGSTSLYIGSLIAPSGLAKEGANSDTALIDLDAVSFLDSVSSFKFKLSGDAPNGWSSGFIINGNTFTDSTQVNMTLSQIIDIKIFVVPDNTAGLGNYTLEMSSTLYPNADIREQNVIFISGITDLIVSNSNSLGDGSAVDASNWEADFNNGLDYAGNTAFGSTDDKILKELQLNNALNSVNNVYFNVGWTFPSLTDDLVAVFQTFMDNGGNLLIAGQDIGWETWEASSYGYGSSATRYFYTNYLGAEHVTDGSSASSTASYIAADFVFGSLTSSSNIIGPYDASSTHIYPDVMKVKDSSTIIGASAFLNYNNSPNLIGGVRYDNGTHKSVYLGIGLEMLEDSLMRKEFIKTAHDWFYHTVSGIALNEVFSDFKLYPNPGRDFLNLDLGHINEIMIINLFDLKGQMVLGQEISNSDIRLDIRGLNKGTYMIEISDQKGQKHSVKKLEIY